MESLIISSCLFTDSPWPEEERRIPKSGLKPNRYQQADILGLQSYQFRKTLHSPRTWTRCFRSRRTRIFENASVESLKRYSWEETHFLKKTKRAKLVNGSCLIIFLPLFITVPIRVVIEGAGLVHRPWGGVVTRESWTGLWRNKSTTLTQIKRSHVQLTGTMGSRLPRALSPAVLEFVLAPSARVSTIGVTSLAGKPTSPGMWVLSTSSFSFPLISDAVL